MGWGKEEEERKKEKKWYRYNGTTPRWCSAPAADGQTNWFFPLSLGLSLIFSVYMIFRDRNLLVRDIWSSTVISNQPTAPLLLLASLFFFAVVSRTARVSCLCTTTAVGYSCFLFSFAAYLMATNTLPTTHWDLIYFASMRQSEGRKCRHRGDGHGPLHPDMVGISTRGSLQTTVNAVTDRRHPHSFHIKPFGCFFCCFFCLFFRKWNKTRMNILY